MTAGSATASDAPAQAELARTVRTEGARILATLIRTVGDLQLAEDAVQEASIRALRDWPRSGVPAEPRAWLTVTARRVAIDMLRRERTRITKERDGSERGSSWRPIRLSTAWCVTTSFG